jgi:hypothetical protein
MIKKILIGMFIIIGMFSCDKDDDNADLRFAEPNANFLAKTTPQFLATLNSEPLEWVFGIRYQMGQSIEYSDEVTAPSPIRRLGFGLNENNGDNYFAIRTPGYDTSSDLAFDNVFGLGLKNIGDSDDDFKINIQNNNVNYQSCGSDAGYTLEILKTEEFEVETFGESGNIISTYIRVWMKIQDINLNDCDITADENLTGSLVLAHFNGFRTE